MCRVWSALIVISVSTCFADLIDFTYYQLEDSEDISVATTGFTIEKYLLPSTAITFDIEIDRVDEPPIDMSDLDAVSGASRPSREAWSDAGDGQRQRGQILMGVSHTVGQVTLGLQGYASEEIDYQSKAIIASTSIELAQKNARVSLSGQYAQDSVGELGEGTVAYESKTVTRGDVSFMQLLSPVSFITLGGHGEVDRGYLKNPYRVFSITQNSDEIRKDHLPYSRYRASSWVSLTHMFASMEMSIIPLYRYYWDDWELTAHTMQMTINKYIVEDLWIACEYRYHTQQQSKFYVPRFNRNTHTSDFYTSDSKLSTLSSQSISTTLHWGLSRFAEGALTIIAESALALKYTHYVRTLNEQDGELFTADGIEFSWVFDL
ncbi:MAG: DUF3570 domain-containing protein [Reichenbachiella sp.]